MFRVYFFIKRLMWALVLISVASHGEAHDLDLALYRMKTFDVNQWSFVLTSSGQINRVEKYTPGKQMPWSLISVDGFQPTNPQLDKYINEKGELRDAEDEQYDLSDMIESGSVKFEMENENVAVYSFKPLIDGKKPKYSDSLIGEIRVNKDENYIEHLEFYAIEEFSPALSVKIKEMKMAISFKKIAEDTYAPSVMSINVRGKAMLFNSIEQNDTKIYEKYRLISSLHQAVR